MLHHFAHCKEIFVKKGDRVAKGQKIAAIGNTGNSKGAHLHCESQKIFRSWTSYTKGMTRQEVLNHYEEPKNLSLVLPNFDHYGYRWLDDIGGGQLHPGVDLNAGGNDEGVIFYSPVNGTVEYVGIGFSDGWGNHFFIKEDEEQFMTYDLFRQKDQATVYERLNNYALVAIPSIEHAIKFYGPDWEKSVQLVDDITLAGWIAEDPRPLRARIEDLSNHETQLTTQISDNIKTINTLRNDSSKLQEDLEAEKTRKTELMAQIGELSKPMTDEQKTEIVKDMTFGQVISIIWQKISKIKIGE